MANRLLILRRSLHVLSAAKSRQILLSRRQVPFGPLQIIPPNRSFITVAGLIRSVLKIRYIVLGSAISGGIHLNNVSL